MAHSKTPLLDQVNTPADLRKLSEKELTQFSRELRQDNFAGGG